MRQHHRNERWVEGDGVGGWEPLLDCVCELREARVIREQCLLVNPREGILEHDAWLLSAYLERLGTAAGSHLAGATGTLRVDGFGNVLRTPAWSTLSGGVAIPLADAERR